MGAQINRLLGQHLPSLGYSTCFWYTVRRSQILHDTTGWFTLPQQRCQQEYPEPLPRSIIAYNYPVLRQVIPSYYNQLEKAVRRQDMVSINHRLAALFASYFDIIFTATRVLHPSEKRIVSHVRDLCAHVPDEMESDIERVLASSSTDLPTLLPHLDRLLDRLDQFLEGI